MSALAQVGIQFILDIPGFKSALTQLTQLTSNTFSALQTEFTRQAKASSDTISKSSVESARKATEAFKAGILDNINAQSALEKAEKKMNDLRVKYSHDAGKEIIDDIKKQQDEKARLLHAITLTADKEAQDELKSRKKVIDEELRLMKQVALDKDSVNKGGAGGKAGLLGTGRQVAGSALSSVIPQSSALSPITDALGSIGPKAAIAATGIGAVAAGIGVAISIGKDFQDNVAELGAITGQEGPELENLGKKARELGKNFGEDAGSGVEALKLAVSALGTGVAKDQNALGSMGNSIMTLAKAAGVEAVQATDALTITMNQFGYGSLTAAEQAKQMERIMNVMAAGAKEGAAEVPDLAASMKVVGTVANQSGISIEQTAAAVETLSTAGIKGAEAGTGFRNVLMSMSSGTKEAADSLKKMGLSYDDINPKKVGLDKALENLNKGFSSLTDPVERAAAQQKIFGKENAASANVLMSNTKLLGELTTKLTGTNEATEQAKKRQETFSAQLGKVMANLKDLAITIFQAIYPALNLFMKGLMGVIGIVTDVVNGIAKVITVITDVGSAIGDFLGLTEKKVEASQKKNTETIAESGAEQVAITEEAQTKQVEATAAGEKAMNDAIRKERKTREQLLKEAYELETRKHNEALADKLHKIELAFDDGKKTENEAKFDRLKAEDEHNSALLTLAEKHHQDKKALEQKAESSAVALKRAQFELDKDLSEKTLQNELQMLDNRFELGLEGDTKTYVGRAQAELAAAERLKELQEKNGYETLNTDRKILSLRIQLSKSLLNDFIAEQEERFEQHNHEQKRLKEEGVITEKQFELEMARFRVEQAVQTEARANELHIELAKLGKATDKLKRDEAALTKKYQKEEQDEQRKQMEAHTKDVEGLQSKLYDILQKGGEDRKQLLIKFAGEEILHQDASFLTQEGGLNRFLRQQLATLAANKAAELALWVSTEWSKTAATETGVIGRMALMAQEIGANVASAASAAYTAVANAIKWVVTAIPWPFNLALIPAAVATVYGLYTGARKLFKFGEGGIVQRAQRFTFGANNQFDGERGEAGDEAIIPLHKLPGILQTLNLLPSAATTSLPIVEEIRQLHNTMKQPPQPIVLDTYKTKISQDQATTVVNSRRL